MRGNVILSLVHAAETCLDKVNPRVLRHDIALATYMSLSRCATRSPWVYCV